MPTALPEADNLPLAAHPFDNLAWLEEVGRRPRYEHGWDIDLAPLAEQEAVQLEPWVGTTGDKSVERVETLIAVSQKVSGLVFPTVLRKKVEQFRQQDDEGAMLLPWFWMPQELRNYVPQSPEFPDQIRAGRTLAVMTLAIASLFGYPFNYKSNPRGAGSIVTSAATLANAPPRSLAGPGEFDLHAEVVGGEIRPDYLVLLCVRGLTHTRTFVVPPKRVIERVDSVTLAKLAEKVYKTKDGLVPDSDTEPHSVIALMNNSKRPSLNFAEGLTKPFYPEDDGAAQALAKLGEVLADPDIKTVHTLQKGNALVIRNDGLHGRTAPGDPGQSPRWMVRAYVRDSQDPRQRGVPFV